MFASKETGDLSSQPTTAILRNLPDDYTRSMLVDTLNSNGFFSRFDFLYLPMNFGTNTSFGYAFINFVTCDDAQRFMTDFPGFSHWSVPSSNRAHVEWSDGRQGLEEQIDRYRNSAMMHASVVDEARPILLRDGVRVSFPAPTLALKPLRVRLWKRNLAPSLQVDASPPCKTRALAKGGDLLAVPLKQRSRKKW